MIFCFTFIGNIGRVFENGFIPDIELVGIPVGLICLKLAITLIKFV
jgi:hypothetical protein